MSSKSGSGGCCEKFSGNVELNVIFVTDNDSKWNSSAQSNAKTEIDEPRTRIKEVAAAREFRSIFRSGITRQRSQDKP